MTSIKFHTPLSQARCHVSKNISILQKALKDLEELGKPSDEFMKLAAEVNQLANTNSEESKQKIDKLEEENKELVKENLMKSFEISHPDNKIKKGIAQVIKDKKIIELDDLKTSDEFYLESAKSQALCKIINMTKI